MISEGPSLIENLPPELQRALDEALVSGEELVIAVRGNPREAFAATRARLLALKAPVVSGLAPVEVREAPLAQVTGVRTEARSIGGRLVWESAEEGRSGYFEFPGYDAAKFGSVVRKLEEMIGRQRNPSTQTTAPPAPTTAAGDQPTQTCPKCQTWFPADAAWCSHCGLMARDPCWECGRPLAEGAAFCSYCGTPNTEPAVVQCPDCRAVVSRGVGYCIACGSQARPVCSTCDRVLRREWTFCPACGGEPIVAGVPTERRAEPAGETPVRASSGTPNRLKDGEAESANEAGTRAYEQEDYQEAIRFFRRATELDGDNAAYWTNLGVAYGQVGDDLQAFNAYRRAVELDPNEVSAYLFMGELYAERERQVEAREMWEQVIRNAPDSEEAGEAREYLRNLEEV